MNVGGWGEESLASRIPRMESRAEASILMAISCFVFSCSDSPPLTQGWGGGSTGQAREAQEDARALLSPP